MKTKTLKKDKVNIITLSCSKNMLDSEALNGKLLAVANQFKIPVKFIGVGEKMEDLLVFDKHEFVDSLFSLEKS